MKYVPVTIGTTRKHFRIVEHLGEMLVLCDGNKVGWLLLMSDNTYSFTTLQGDIEFNHARFSNVFCYVSKYVNGDIDE